MTKAWTPDEDVALRALHAEGKSFTEIAHIMGRSKNSLIGRAYRLNLPKRIPGAPRRYQDRSQRVRLPKPVSTRTERKPPMFLRVVTAPESKPVPLMERTGCCYPTTNEGPFLFCNAPPSGHTDYCEFHRRLMYRARAA